MQRIAPADRVAVLECQPEPSKICCRERRHVGHCILISLAEHLPGLIELDSEPLLIGECGHVALLPCEYAYTIERLNTHCNLNKGTMSQKKKLPARQHINLNLRLARRKQLEQITDDERTDTENPGVSMTVIVEQLIDREHKRRGL